MADYQAIAQGIRSMLRPESRVSQEELADLAASFAIICRETNTRLERCLEYAASGLTSEVAHLASCQPSLDRLVSAFKAIDFTRWAEVCSQHGVTSGPPLLLEDWPTVKAALDSERSLRPLLSRYRTLAIAKSPVADRLKVARALARHDTANPLWSDQVRTLEEARLSEMLIQVKRGVHASDSAALQSLVRELTAETWLSPLPDELVAALEPIIDEEKARAGSKELAELARWFESDAAEKASMQQLEEKVERWRGLRAEYAVNGSSGHETQGEHVEARIGHLQRRLSEQREAEQRELVTSMFHPTTTPAVYARPPARRRRVIAAIAVVIALVGLATVVAVLKPPMLEQWLGKKTGSP